MIGVFNEGLVWLYEKAIRNQYAGTSLYVGLYTNTRGTLTRRNVLANITACAGAGYAPTLLSAAGWSTAIVQGAVEVDDVVTLDRANHVFTASANWGVVTGAYVYDVSNSIAIWWKDFPADYNMVSAAKCIVDFLSDAA